MDLLQDSLSATAPGYPYFLAGLSLIVGDSLVTLRLLNGSLSLLILVMLWRLLHRIGGARFTLFLLPLAVGNFFIKSAGYVVTDNASLLCLTGALVGLFFIPSPQGNWQTSIAAACGVMVRQTGIWLIAPLAWRLLREQRTSARWWSLGLVLFPVIPLVFLWEAWGGLVPPVWTDTHETAAGAKATPLIYLCTVMATLGAPFYLCLTDIRHWREDLKSAWTWIPALAVFCVALLSPGQLSEQSGHWGGYWWNISSLFPLIGGTSLSFAVLAPIGAWLMGALLHRLWRESSSHTALLFAISLLAWMATTLANRVVFHRYYESPLLLFFICWGSLLILARGESRLKRIWPMVALGAAQLMITFVTAHGQIMGFAPSR